jgi:hypothetical protein
MQLNRRGSVFREPFFCGKGDLVVEGNPAMHALPQCGGGSTAGQILIWLSIRGDCSTGGVTFVDTPNYKMGESSELWGERESGGIRDSKGDLWPRKRKAQ